MRQMTMTQLFDPIESPRTTIRKSDFVKQEPKTPSDDTTMFMPESLIGLAQPSDTDNEHVKINAKIFLILKTTFFLIVEHFI